MLISLVYLPIGSLAWFSTEVFGSKICMEVVGGSFALHCLIMFNLVLKRLLKVFLLIEAWKMMQQSSSFIFLWQHSIRVGYVEAYNLAGQLDFLAALNRGLAGPIVAVHDKFVPCVWLLKIIHKHSVGRDCFCKINGSLR